MEYRGQSRRVLLADHAQLVCSHVSPFRGYFDPVIKTGREQIINKRYIKERSLDIANVRVILRFP